MERRGRIEDVHALLYEAVLDDAMWPAAMKAISDHVDGTGTCYLSSDPSTARVLQSEAFGFDPRLNTLYLEHYADKEVRIPGCTAAEVGRVVTEQHLVDLRVFRRSQIFNELLKPFDIPYVMTVCTARSSVESANFVVERSLRQGPFEREHVRRLGRIVPHLKRALVLRNELTSLRARCAATVEWLADLEQAVLFVDADGRIRSMSAAADTLLRTGTALRATAGWLEAASPFDQRRVHGALWAATRSPDGRSATTLLIAASTPAPMVLHVVPVVAGERVGVREHTAMLVLAPLDARGVPNVEKIRELLGLTPAEARLACELYRSPSLAVCARRLGVSAHTCRTHLKSIFAKLGCTSQADLMRRIAWLRGAGVASTMSTPTTAVSTPPTR